MSDPVEKFEAELSALRPRRLSRQVAERIDANLAAKWADRSLIAAMSAGLVAACVTGAVLMTESVSVSAPSGSVAAKSAPALRLGDYSLAVAGAEFEQPGDIR